MEVAEQIRRAYPDATFLIPTTSATHPVVEAAVRRRNDQDAGSAGPPGRAFVYGEGQFDEMVPRCDLCLTVSGTATLHVASFGVPMVVVYAGSRLMWNLLGRWLIQTRTYGLVNLLAALSPADWSSRDAQTDPPPHVVPEFIPWYGPTRPVADLAVDLLRNHDKLADQRRRLEALVRSLDRPGASMNAARLAVELLDRSRLDRPRAAGLSAELSPPVTALGAP
jgi:hypothetical protein